MPYKDTPTRRAYEKRRQKDPEYRKKRADYERARRAKQRKSQPRHAKHYTDEESILIGVWSGDNVPTSVQAEELGRTPEALRQIRWKWGIKGPKKPKKQRQLKGPKTHCKRGHPFDEHTTYIYPDTQHRRCKTCKLLLERRRNTKKNVLPLVSDSMLNVPRFDVEDNTMAAPQIIALVPVGSHICYPEMNTARVIPVMAGANRIMVQAINQNIRYTLDGSEPRVDRGFRLNADNDPLLIYWTSNMTLRVIGEADGATFEGQWMKDGSQ